MNLLHKIDLLGEKTEEIGILSNYYDELFSGTPEDMLGANKDRMKYLREEILKKTFEIKNIIRHIEISEKPKNDKHK
jgi:hypothetical protein